MNVRKRNARVALNKPNNSYLSSLTAREYDRKRRRVDFDVSTHSHRFPFIWDGELVPIKYADKIFASQWLSNEEILIGTKCNHLGVVNLKTHKIYDIPLLEGSTRTTFFEEPCGCGIHAIQKNTTGTLIATGGENVNDVGVYRLPDLSPLCVFEKRHKNCIFDLRWVQEETLASCSRDSCLALWRLPEHDMHSSPMISYDPGSSINRPRPISRHPLISTPVAFTLSRTPDDRFRALEYLPTRNMLTVVSMSHYFYLYDLDSLLTSTSGNQQPFFKMPLLSSDKEAVALRRWPNNPHVVSLATHRSVLLFDIRCRSQIRRTIPRIVEPPASCRSCVRSLNFSGNILSYGTSLGKVHFYDLVADKHLGNHLDTETVSKKAASPPCTYGSYSDYLDDSLPDLAASVYPNGLGSTLERQEEEPGETELSFEFSTEIPSSAPSDLPVSSDSERLTNIDVHLINFISSLAVRPQVRERALQQFRLVTADLRRRISRHSLRVTLEATDVENPIVQVSSDEEMVGDGEEEGGNRGMQVNEVVDQAHLPQPPGNSVLLENLTLDNLNWVEGNWHSVGTNKAVYTHEYDPSGLRLFTAGGPIGSAFSGNFAVLWD
ncbi:DDB1 and CUL4 associated factor 12 [Echinococcus multilocularis]|uniref:DDB1 and CUL4 associated factor 12 n=1 Tax=Echinococcus multilocularis TaxID=6211 RepID=A0A087VWR9_ECHMU|nr:DDB1 and CUL4 associated factor 12 [Echinococcus multilocularis]